ncbi:IS200/IS605 family element transposase accessory protein TnpB [Halosimplex rubrum]|uniref:IS200/IS605 family element transposase accessory protein TnpB n=1 Tax=Halosimplex rubrum TaxID=869889 RepID=A0A7D5PAJ4_9EURY|nr:MULTISPECIES: RNA-guided endonuclease TnpB family protein [Halobacteriales]QLH78340.1 IS200/IS605 family element transposase accessory protein TnpB [Halosimplex rubrum]
MEVVRNIQLKLDVPEDAHSVLDETFEQFRQAAQHVADAGWSDDPTQIKDTKNTLHEQTYTTVREQTGLQASLVQSARNLAADALGNCKDRILDDGKKASKPEFRGSVVVYNGRTITYNDDHVTLATVDDRVTAEFVTPEDEEGTPFAEYWTDDWERKEATLHKRDGTYYLHVAVEKEVEPADSGDQQPENGVVLGVDLNVDGYLAVTSTGAFLGNADYLNHKRDEYERRRGNLQQTGTRSAHLTIKSIGSRFSRWSADYLHRVSKAIVQEAVENDCTAIAFENLNHIRKRISNASKFQQWAFRELERHVEYKAEEYGIDVDDVAPAYTSQRCSHDECGFTHEDNRDGDEFECLKCGKKLHADYNAARNIGWRLVQHWLKSGAGRATSQLALKSGTLNANGTFTPSALRG